MVIGNYTAYTAKDLREGLGRIYTLLGILKRPQGKEKEKAFNNQYTEIIAEKDKDKLFYIYQFITRMAWLFQGVTSHDDLHFKEKE